VGVRTARIAGTQSETDLSHAALHLPFRLSLGRADVASAAWTVRGDPVVPWDLAEPGALTLVVFRLIFQ